MKRQEAYLDLKFKLRCLYRNPPEVERDDKFMGTVINDKLEAIGAIILGGPIRMACCAFFVCSICLRTRKN